MVIGLVANKRMILLVITMEIKRSQRGAFPLHLSSLTSIKITDKKGKQTVNTIN